MSFWRERIFNPTVLVSFAIVMLSLAFEVDTEWLRRALDALAAASAIGAICLAPRST